MVNPNLFTQLTLTIYLHAQSNPICIYSNLSCSVPPTFLSFGLVDFPNLKRPYGFQMSC
jgi:hypothetical protein